MNATKYHQFKMFFGYCEPGNRVRTVVYGAHKSFFTQKTLVTHVAGSKTTVAVKKWLNLKHTVVFIKGVYRMQVIE